MNKKRIVLVLLAAGAVLSASGGIAARAQDVPAQPETVDAILGSWVLEVDAEGEFYDLTLVLSLKEGRLAGELSEANGWFSNVPLAEPAWDGKILKFTVVTPTPPDGADRTWSAEMKKSEDRWAGWIALPELGMSVPVTGARR